MSASTCLDFTLALWPVKISSAVENTLSEGTLVVGTHRRYSASLESKGYFVL